jgi:hypothetical protein
LKCAPTTLRDHLKPHVNYARFTHRENNGNKWFVAVTCLAADDTSIGGNFHTSSYGVMMLVASNTMTAFQPTQYHGTTLYEIDLDPWPRDSYEQRPDGGEKTGFTFEVSKSLRHAKRKGDAIKQARPGSGGYKKRRTRLSVSAPPGTGDDNDGE